jgi:hypothetical protein
VILPSPWSTIEASLQAIAEGRSGDDGRNNEVLQSFGFLGLRDAAWELTHLGERYYLARFVTEDTDGTREALHEALRDQPVATAFCSALRTAGTVAVAGAINLLKRLGTGDDTAARRWLDLMNRAGWIAYNRAHPKLRVLYNPDEIVPPEDDAERERGRGHVIAPDTGYGNLLAMRELIRSSRTFIRWYEQHMPRKVLEVLYREVDGEAVSEIRLLSGPANIDSDAKDEFKRFAKEMKAKRGVTADWRILSKHDAFLHHDRFFLSDGLARNLPPLNSILKGSTGEILPSDLTPEEFDKWWATGESIMSFTAQKSE